jgi:hypothetical protein
MGRTRPLRAATWLQIFLAATAAMTTTANYEGLPHVPGSASCGLFPLHYRNNFPYLDPNNRNPVLSSPLGDMTIGEWSFNQMYVCLNFHAKDKHNFFNLLYRGIAIAL